MGVDGVELDVRRSADGALVVHHDPVGRRGASLPARRLETCRRYVPDSGRGHGGAARAQRQRRDQELEDSSEPTYDETGDFAREVLESLADLRSSQALTSRVSTWPPARRFVPSIARSTSAG